MWVFIGLTVGAILAFLVWLNLGSKKIYYKELDLFFTDNETLVAGEFGVNLQWNGRLLFITMTNDEYAIRFIVSEITESFKVQIWKDQILQAEYGPGDEVSVPRSIYRNFRTVVSHIQNNY